MCIHALIIFACSHAQWGERVRACIIGQEFQEGRLPEDCVFKKPHGFKTTRLYHSCDECGGADEDETASITEKSLGDETESETTLDRQMERAAREERERRFEEEKVGLEEIKRLKKGILAYYESAIPPEEYSDGWIYSDNGEIKTSPRRESFDIDQVEEVVKSQRDSAIGLGISSPDGPFHTDHGFERSDTPSDGLHTTSPRASGTPEPSLSSPSDKDRTKRSILPPGSISGISSTPTSTKKPAYSKLPRTAPKSGVAAAPVCKPPSQSARATSTPSPPPKQSISKSIQRPSTPPFRGTGSAKSTPKSRLAVPVSKPAPRYAATSGTPAKSGIPKPGFKPRKPRDSGCSFGLGDESGY